MAAETFESRQYAATLTNQSDTEAMAFSEAEAARVLSLSPRSVYSLRKAGKLRFFKVGARVLVSRQACADFIAAQEKVTSAEAGVAK